MRDRARVWGRTGLACGRCMGLSISMPTTRALQALIKPRYPPPHSQSMVDWPTQSAEVDVWGQELARSRLASLRLVPCGAAAPGSSESNAAAPCVRLVSSLPWSSRPDRNQVIVQSLGRDSARGGVGWWGGPSRVLLPRLDALSIFDAPVFLPPSSSGLCSMLCWAGGPQGDRGPQPTDGARDRRPPRRAPKGARFDSSSETKVSSNINY